MNCLEDFCIQLYQHQSNLIDKQNIGEHNSMYEVVCVSPICVI